MSEKKTVIIQGAIEALANKQINELSMEDIAKHAGVSVGTIYNYFKSKDELIEALYISHESEFIKHVHTISQDSSVLGFKKMDMFLGSLLVFFANNIAVAKIWLASWHTLQPQRTLHVERSKVRNVLNECIVDEYGEAIKPYLRDIQILVEGMFIAVAGEMYLGNYANDDRRLLHQPFDVAHVAKRLTHTIRGICDSTLHSDIPPIFTDSQHSRQYQQRLIEKLLQIADRFAVALDEAELPVETKENLRNIILFIRSECNNEQPRIFLIIPLLKEFMLYKHLLREAEQAKELEALLQSQ